MCRYMDQDNSQAEVYCNACGRKLKMKNGLLLEDAFEVRKDWGYFSGKDLESHRFTLCEACYDEIIQKFKIPITKKQTREAL